MMTVEELIEELRAMPRTAQVFIETQDDEDDWIDEPIDEVLYQYGKVSLRFVRVEES